MDLGNHPSITKAIIMGLKVETRIMDTSQRNHGYSGASYSLGKLILSTTTVLFYISVKFGLPLETIFVIMSFLY